MTPDPPPNMASDSLIVMSSYLSISIYLSVVLSVNIKHSTSLRILHPRGSESLGKGINDRRLCTAILLIMIIIASYI